MAKVGAKYKWDEKTQKFVEVKGSYQSSKSTSNKSYEKSGTVKKDVITDPAWEKFISGVTAKYATDELSKVPTQLERYQSEINKDLFKRGAGATLPQTNYQLGKIGRDTTWRQKFLKDSAEMLGVSEDEVNAILEAPTANAEIADDMHKLTRARTGDRSVLQGIDKDSAEYRHYSNLMRLYGYDVTGAGLMKQNKTKTYEELAELSRDFDLPSAMTTVNDYYSMINTPVMGDGLSAAKVDEADYEKAAADIEAFTGINVRDLAPEAVQPVMDAVGAASEYVDYLKSSLNTEAKAASAVTAQDMQKKWQEDFNANWGGLRNNPDFDELSHVEKRKSWLGRNPYGDVDYLHPSEVWPNQVFPEVSSGIFDYMTEDQLREFTYLINQPDDGEAQAESYLKDLAPELLRLRAEDQIKKAQEFAGKNVFTGAAAFAGARAGNVLNSIVGMADMLATPFALAGSIVNPDAMQNNPNSTQYDFARWTQAIEQENLGNIAEATEKWNIGGVNVPSQIYSGIGSAVDSLLAGTALGPAGAAAALSANAYETSRFQGDDRLDAGMTALFEGLTEKFSLDKLFGDTGSAVKTIFQNMLVEPTEELANMALNMGWDSMRYGSNGEIGTRFDELRTMGYNEFDASMQIAKEYGKEALATVLSSAVAGLFGGSVSAARTAVDDASIARDLQNNNQTRNMLEVARTLPLSEEVQALVGDQLAAIDAWDAARADSVARKDAEQQTEMNRQRTEDAMLDVEEDADIEIPEMSEEDQQKQIQNNEQRTEETMREVAEEDAEIDPEVAAEDAKNQQRVNEAKQEATMREPAAKTAAKPTKPESGKGVDKVKARADAKAQKRNVKDMPKLSNSKLGRIYRESFKALDEAAQEVLSANYSKHLRGELVRKTNGSMPGQVANLTAKAISDFMAGRKITAEQRKLIVNSSAALEVLNEATSAEAYQAKAVQLANMRSREYVPFNLKRVAEEDYGDKADIVVSGIAPGQDEQTYAEQFRRAYNYGAEGRNLEVVQQYGSVSALTGTQVAVAYNMGRDARVAEQESARKVAAGVEVGNVDTTVLRGMTLNKAQKNAVYAASSLAKALKINIKFIRQTANAKGQITGKNGSWNSKTRTLELDLNAGRLSEDSTNFAIMNSLGHELTHYIRQFADAKLWTEYQDFVMSHLSQKMDEKALNAAVADMIERNAAEGKTLDRDGAIEEVIAEASSNVLMQMTEQDFADIARTSPSLFDKIKGFIERWAKGVIAAIRKGYEGQTEKPMLAAQMEDAVDEMSRKWMAMLKNAAEKSQAAETAAATEIGEDIAVNAQEEVDFSLRENERLMQAAADVNRKLGNIAYDLLDKAASARAEVAAFMRDDSRTLNLPEDLMGNTFFSDAAYGGTEENTTVCPRSIGADAFLDAVSDRIGRPLTVAEQVRISQDLIGAANMKEPQCIYCYVAADRAAYREYLGRYIEQRDSVINALKSGETDTAVLYETFLAGRKDTKDMKKRFDLWVDTYRKGNRLLSAGDLANIGVLTSIQADKFRDLKDDPNFAAQMKDALKYAQSASWAKKRVNYVAYNGHILKWKQNRIDKLNSMYGLRMYSFSDFSPAFALENMQMVTDASVRGLKMLAYTKVPAFAEIFADTGMNINVSVFATEVQGDSGSSIVENNLMGADWKSAQALRSEHENVGITFVATSDAQVYWALDQEWIDVVIPYHLVRTGRTIAEIMKYKNFTAESGDTKKPGWSKAAGNLSSIPAALHNNDRDTYMRLLEENNLEPRFPRFLKHDNYMKLVNETRKSVTASKPVQPIFNTDAAINALQDMANNGGYYTPIGGSDQRMYELAGEFADNVQAGKYQTDIAEDDVKLSVRKDTEYMKPSLASDFADAFFMDDSDTKFSVRVTDRSTLKFLNNQETVTTYKTMQVVDGKLYPPMAAVVAGKYEDDSKLGAWEQATERPDLIKLDNKGKPQFNLNKGKGKGSLNAAYNPYMHSSNLVLNDQFSGAYDRPNLVTVECEVPVSELTSGYHAQYAKDSVGWHAWHTGTVAGALRRKTGIERQVLLSRWIKPVRIVPDAEVAQMYKELLGGTGIAVPDNVVPPSLLRELKKAGVEISVSGRVPDSDTRFQLRDPSQITNRELLVNALDTAMTNDAERDGLARYKGKVAALNADQAKLEETKQRIGELRKAGEKANRDELIKLRNNAATLEKRIQRADSELLKFEATKTLNDVVKRERAAVRKRTEERMRDNAYEKIGKLKQEKREAVAKVREQKDESHGKEKYRKRIEEDVAKLRTWVTTPTNKEHVPQFLRKPLGDLINALDFSSARSLKGGELTQKDKKLMDALDAMNLALVEIRKQQSGLEEGAAAFASIIDLPFGYTEAFAELVAEIKTRMDVTQDAGDIPINRMTAKQLKELSIAIRTLTTSIRQMNRLLANAKYESARSAADATIDELARMTAKRTSYKAMDAIGRFMDWTNTVPYYAFKRFGKGGQAIFDGLMDGWDKLAVNSDKVIKFTNAAYTTKEVREWSREVRDVELSSGETVQMTTAQLMSLYCLSRRAQAVGHLLGGGIRIADIDSKGKRISQSENYTLTEMDTAAFGGMLTARQREVADELQGFMSTQGAEWGNEVSMKRFGYEMFTERFYFPIETDSNNRKAIDEQAQENSLFRLLNMSATKGLIKGANNALVVRDIFDVFAAHTADMAKYNALGLQILDALKWLNYVEKTQNDDGTLTTRSVQKSLERAYGKDARKYILNLIKDLNGVREGGRNDGLVNKVISNAKIASVAGNVRVWLLQATSMPRAAYAINPKYLATGFARMAANPLKGKRMAEDKAGIAKWKALGFYDTNISGNIREMIKHDQTVPSKIRDKTLAPAGFMDGLTMGVIYYAAEAECKEKYRSTPVGSKAWDKLVNNRVREIVYQTQVVDSTMTRSDAMRGKGIVTLATSFMSEPTLTMNMLADSIYEARMNKRAGESLKAPTAKMIRAATVFAFTAILTAAVESLFDAERDDDEYETFGEKYMAAFIGEITEDDKWFEKAATVLFSNVGSNLNILNSIPFASDAMGMLEGFDNSPMYSAFIDSFKSSWDAYHRWLDGKGEWYSWVYNGLKGVSQLSGLPVSNVTREVISAWNTFFADQTKMPRIQTYSDNRSDAAKAYYAAIESGDMRRADFIMERARINGLPEDKIEASVAGYIKDDYIDGNIDEATARKQLSKYGGKSSDAIDTNIKEWSYQRETGHKYDDMRSDYISGAISKSQMQQILMKYRGYDSDEVYWQLSSWDWAKTHDGKDGGKFSWFLEAVDNGSGYQKYADELLSHGVEKSKIAGEITEKFKPRYIELYGTTEGDRLREYLLDVYEYIGYDREYEWDRYMSKWVDD